MKVYVITKAKPLEAEQYVTVKSSAKAAEKYIRSYFPNARKDDNGVLISFECRGRYDMIPGLPGKDVFLMFIREETIE